MKTIFVWACLLAVLIEPCISDMYLHFPAGSNNRLNGNQDNVRNANRLFDSQVGRDGILPLYSRYHSLADARMHRGREGGQLNIRQADGI